jgi:hypothetical protein
VCSQSVSASAIAAETAVIRGLGMRRPAGSSCSAVFADPLRLDAAALGDLDFALADLTAEYDPTTIVRLGQAAVYVDRVATCRTACWRVVRDGREGGAVASSIHALNLLAHDALCAGEWEEAERFADEGVALCERVAGLVRPVAPRADRGAARRPGEDRALTGEIQRWAMPRGALAVPGYVSRARGARGACRRRRRGGVPPCERDQPGWEAHR